MIFINSDYRSHDVISLLIQQSALTNICEWLIFGVSCPKTISVFKQTLIIDFSHQFAYAGAVLKGAIVLASAEWTKLGSNVNLVEHCFCPNHK